MNWHKIAKLETFLDRNALNKRIREFKEMVQVLNYLQRYVFQNAKQTREILCKMRDDKKMSSFPHIKEVLNSASKIALDNYQKCSELCFYASEDLREKVEEMVKERNDFVPKSKGVKDAE